MNDKNLNTIIKIAFLFLIAAGIFCAVMAGCTGEEGQNDVRVAERRTENTGEQASQEAEAQETEPQERKIIVLDAGHGKQSNLLTDAEKSAEGYMYNEVTDGWGEWRHYKDGTFGEDCYGSECTLTAPRGGSCWYPMENSDRELEPEINLNNALAAKQYLEELGYEVRMTRTSNDEAPSMNKRVSYCFPDNDITQLPDAALYVCIHSNAGGGSGSSYIALEDEYRQGYIPQNYIEESNRAGEIINEKIAKAAGLGKNSPIKHEGYLILFNKCPVPIAYLEIGFFDNPRELDIINSSSDAIGRAIAEGVDEYMN